MLLIATLGQRPAAVTMAVDWLTTQYTYDAVRILHTDPMSSGIRDSLARLKDEVDRHEPYRSLAFEYITLARRDGSPLQDTDTQTEAEAYFHAVLGQLVRARQAGHDVHVLVSGGRKAMSIYTVVAASFVLSYQDRIWTSIVPAELIRPDLWHVPITWQHSLRVVALPFRASRLTSGQLDDIPTDTLVWGDRPSPVDQLRQSLTPTEKIVVEAILNHPYKSDRDIAAMVHRSHKTIEGHLGRIYRKLEQYFEVPPENKRSFLRDVLTGHHKS